MLGLIGTEQTEDFWSQNTRRMVFHEYPNGAFTLLAILSLLAEEGTDKTRFGWEEKYYQAQRSTTAAANANGPFTSSGGNVDLTTGGWTLGANTVIRVKLVANGVDNFGVNDTVVIYNVPIAGGGFVDINGLIVSLVSGTQFEMILLEGVTSALNDTTVNGLQIDCIGNANAEFAGIEGRSRFRLPVEPMNLTQIFRKPFSFTRNALQEGLKWDKTGPYKEAAKDALVEHMTNIEWSMLFGVQSIRSVQRRGQSVQQRTMGGVLDFLKKWEAADSLYRGGTGAPAITDVNDPLKRIIQPTDGVITPTSFGRLIQRAFRYTFNKSFEKIGVCGGGFLQVLNEMYSGTTNLTEVQGNLKTFGMDVVKQITPHGTIWWKTHPLFTENPQLTNNCMILETATKKYRPFNNADTEVYKFRQQNDEDGRIDEWLTECSLEGQFPAADMYIKGVTAWQH